MDPAHQQQMWRSPPPLEPSFPVTSDSDHWDAAAELLAFIDDPVMNDAQPEDVVVVTTDLSLHELLSEEYDIAGIVYSTDEKAPGSPVVEGAVHSASFKITVPVAAEATKRAGGSQGTAAQSSVRSRATKDPTAQASTALALSASMLSSAEEARRERNRLKVRRLYYRKLDRMNALRTQVANLEEKLESFKLAQNSTNSTELSVITATTQPTRPSVDYADLLQQLSRTKYRLQHENEYLRHIISQHVKSVHAISVKLTQQREPSTAYLKIKSVTRPECAELRGRTLKNVRNFARNRSLFQDAGSVCGWQSMQLVQDNVHQFSIEKTLSSHSASTIAQMVWSVVSNPDQFVRLYSQGVDMKCYLLQTIDDDNVVIFQEFRTMIPHEERRAVLRTILLVSRMRSESGFLITITSLDRDKWVLEDPATNLEYQDTMIIWNELSCWMQYQKHMPSSSSESARLFAGFVPIVGSNVSFWILEMLQLAVRCETMAVGMAAVSLLSTTATTEDEGGTNGT